MSFSGVFAIGLSGVNAHAASLENVSNNIANSQTTGFKRARTDFSSLVTFQTADGGGIQAGGVDADNRALVHEQGSVTRTSSETDLAILGDGFFVVSPDADPANASLLTRSGQFSIQEDGTLRNEAGYALMGSQISGSAPITSASLSSLQVVNVNQISGLAEATSEISLEGVFSNAAQIGDTFAHRVQRFDANGDVEDIIFNFTNAGANTWTVTAALASSPASTFAAGTAVFDAAGDFNASASSFPQSIAPSGGSAIAVDLSGLNSGAGATRITQSAANGAAFGVFTGVSIAENGVVTAQFSNGLTREIYQLFLANVRNPDGLTDGPDTTFLTNSQSGAVTLDVPQSGRAGAIESAALELSTVDIGQEFSTLIETQRAYAANTRVITIADELWRTLTGTAA